MRDKNMWEALVEANRDDHLDKLDMAEVMNYENRWPGSCLHHAAMWGHTDLVRLLICAGDDVNRANRWGVTPLHLACNCYQLSCARVLINAGAEVNARDNSGRPPLHMVANDALDIAKLLLESGADINLAADQGATALHQAVQGFSSEKWALVDLLLDFEASITKGYGYYDKTPLALALERIIGQYQHKMYEPFWRLAKACGKTSINVNGFKLTLEEL